MSELRNRGIPAIYTKEPFSHKLKPAIENLSRGREANATALAFLVAADRSLHLDRIQEWVRQGKYVICDRYKLSSLVYQRIDGVSPTTIRQINSTFKDPDSLFLFIAPIELRIERLSHERRDSRHRFLSRESLAREQRIYSGYARSRSSGFTVVDGSLEPREIVNQVLQVIEKTPESRPM